MTEVSLSWEELRASAADARACAASVDEAIHEIFDGTAPAVAGTPGLENTINAAEAERLYLIEKHAYAVIGRNEDGLLLLHNPWGDRHPKPLAVEQFQRLFTRVFWTKER